MHYSILRSSTSNISVAFGGMTPGWPVVPYAMSGVQVSFALWPRLIYSTEEKKVISIFSMLFFSPPFAVELHYSHFPGVVVFILFRCLIAS